MSSRARTVVMLLLFALPWQVFASASMFVCSHDVAHAAAQVLAHSDGAADFVGAPSDRDHHPIKSLADACSSCGECCCPATLTAFDPAALVFGERHSAVIPYVEQPSSGAVPERLDRPPRTNLV
jgi:hypothetical protein